MAPIKSGNAVNGRQFVSHFSVAAERMRRNRYGSGEFPIASADRENVGWCLLLIALECSSKRRN